MSCVVIGRLWSEPSGSTVVSIANLMPLISEPSFAISASRLVSSATSASSCPTGLTRGSFHSKTSVDRVYQGSDAVDCDPDLIPDRQRERIGRHNARTGQ